MSNNIFSELKSVLHSKNRPMVLVAGPCVINSLDEARQIISVLQEKLSKFENRIYLIFKGSYDKANRTSMHSYRGIGIKKGLDILNTIREEYQVPILSDVHEINEIQFAKDVLDVIQIPAFLCRQTNLIIESAKTNRIINIKKGQFMSPYDMNHVAEKIRSVSENYMFTERGSCFGYGSLINDFRAIAIMKELAPLILYDATHSQQQYQTHPNYSLSRNDFSHILSRCAIAAGANGLYLEVHPQPSSSLSDSQTIFPLSKIQSLIDDNLKIYDLMQTVTKSSLN